MIVGQDNNLQPYLPDRTPSFKNATRYLESDFKEARTFPIIIIAIEHDGASEVALGEKCSSS